MQALEAKTTVLKEALEKWNKRWENFVKGQRLRLLTTISPKALETIMNMKIIDSNRNFDTWHSIEFDVTFMFQGEIRTLEKDNWGTVHEWFDSKEDKRILKNLFFSNTSPFPYAELAKELERARKEEFRIKLKDKYVSGAIIDIVSEQKEVDDDDYFLLLNDGIKAKIMY